MATPDPSPATSVVSSAPLPSTTATAIPTSTPTSSDTTAFGTASTARYLYFLIALVVVAILLTLIWCRVVRRRRSQMGRAENGQMYPPTSRPPNRPPRVVAVHRPQDEWEADPVPPYMSRQNTALSWARNALGMSSAAPRPNAETGPQNPPMQSNDAAPPSIEAGNERQDYFSPHPSPQPAVDPEYVGRPSSGRMDTGVSTTSSNIPLQSYVRPNVRFEENLPPSYEAAIAPDTPERGDASLPAASLPREIGATGGSTSSAPAPPVAEIMRMPEPTSPSPTSPPQPSQGTAGLVAPKPASPRTE